MMKKRLITTIASCLIAVAMLTGCGSNEPEKVQVTFMNGEEILGTVETNKGAILDEANYEVYEDLEGNVFEGWFKTPSYLDASKVDLLSESFEEDTILYGLFKSDSVTEDTRKWYIVGSSSSGLLAISNWAAEISDDEKAMFELVGTGNPNEFSITIDLYSGDQFQIIPDWAWDDQMGFGYVKEYDEVQIENGGGLSGSDKTSNINVVADGKYTITVVTNPDDAAQNSITIEKTGEADAAEAQLDVTSDEEFTLSEDTNVKVKGSWVEDWSELRDLDKKGDGIFEITMDLEAQTELYFSIYEGDIDTQLGLKSDNLTEDSNTLVEDAYNIQVKEAGTYTFVVDLNAFTVKVTK